MNLNVDTDVVKKPMVYIRIIEIFLSLICFCCVVAFSVCVEVKISCVSKNHKTITDSTGFCIEYPFSLSNIALEDICSDSTYPAYILTVNYDSQSEFFVAVGVISMLFALVTLIFYIKFWDKYNYTTYFPFPDLLITFTLATFWFSSSCSWASAVTSLSQYADYESILSTIKSLVSCEGADNTCSVSPENWSYGTLIFSVILGFVNVVIWYWNSFLLFRNLKLIKVEEQKRLDAVTAAVDYPVHGDPTAPIRDAPVASVYGSAQSNKPIF